MVQIKFLTLEFKLKSIDEIKLPSFKGSSFRGGFGKALKSVVCTLKTKECGECILREKCLYAYVFETIPPSSSKMMRKYKASPHPFIIEPPFTDKKIFEKGEDLSFKFILLGKAIDYLPYFIYAFCEFGKYGIGRERGKFEVEKVLDRDKIIYSIEDGKVLTPETGQFELNLDEDIEKEGKGTITFNFITPTRIVEKENLLKEVDFQTIVRYLLRRISLISYFHCGIDPTNWQFKRIIEIAKEVKTIESNLKWYDWERYSSRQKGRMKLGGFIGEVTFEGEIVKFLSLIKAGEILHLGKGTSFGLGKYLIL